MPYLPLRHRLRDGSIRQTPPKNVGAPFVSNDFYTQILCFEVGTSSLTAAGRLIAEQARGIVSICPGCPAATRPRRRSQEAQRTLERVHLGLDAAQPRARGRPRARIPRGVRRGREVPVPPLPEALPRGRLRGRGSLSLAQGGAGGREATHT